MESNIDKKNIVKCTEWKPSNDMTVLEVTVENHPRRTDGSKMLIALKDLQQLRDHKDLWMGLESKIIYEIKGYNPTMRIG